jgi:hypothetical protein
VAELPSPPDELDSEEEPEEEEPEEEDPSPPDELDSEEEPEEEDPSAAEDDPSVVLECGACAGALSVEVPVEVPLPVRVPVAPVELWALREDVARVSLSVLPGKALAATAVSTPVSVALPAISQRLARRSRRRAASREREVWLGLTDIDRGGVAMHRSKLSLSVL